MKIVQLCPYAMSRPGGVQRHVRDLAGWLRAQGHDTRIVAPPAPGAAPRADGQLCEIGHARPISLHGTGFEISLAAPWAVRRLARELRGWGADLVHMHTPWTPMLVWQMWRALALPTVTTIHATLPGPDGRGLHDRYIRRAARHFLRHSIAVTAPSQAPVAMLEGLAPGVAIEVLPPAVDLSGWRALADTGREGGPIRMVFLGRLEERKGVPILLEAWRQVSETVPGLHLTVAGEGALRSMVETAVARDASGRLTYAGHPDDADARALVAAADLFLAPAPYGESFGIVLAEAMSAGAVPIAAANPGYASVLTGPGADLLVPPGDAAALAARIRDLTGDPTRRAALRDWGRGHAEGFDIRAVGPAYLDLYARAAG